MAQQHHLRKSPSVSFHRSSQKSGHLCIMTRRTKSLEVHCEQEARHFGFSGHFAHFRHFYFDELVVGLSSDQLHIEMSVISTRWRYKLPWYIRIHNTV